MLYDYNNFSSTRRNLLLSNLFLFLSMLSIDKVAILNLYFFKIDFSKLPIGFSDIMFVLTFYFFLIYFSFLAHNENDAIDTLNKSYFIQFRKNKNKNTLLKFIFIILTPIHFIIDSLTIKNFAIIFTPFIVTFILIFLYFVQHYLYFDSIISIFIFILLPYFYTGLLDVLDMIYERNKNKTLNKETIINLKEKYRINKIRFLSKRK